MSPERERHGRESRHSVAQNRDRFGAGKQHPSKFPTRQAYPYEPDEPQLFRLVPPAAGKATDRVPAPGRESAEFRSDVKRRSIG